MKQNQSLQRRQAGISSAKIVIAAASVAATLAGWTAISAMSDITQGNTAIASNTNQQFPGDNGNTNPQFPGDNGNTNIPPDQNATNGQVPNFTGGRHHRSFYGNNSSDQNNQNGFGNPDQQGVNGQQDSGNAQSLFPQARSRSSR